MSSCHSCIGASRCHRLYLRACRCSCGLTRPLRASTRCTVARPGTAAIPRWPSSELIRRAPHRGCSRRSWQIERLDLGVHPRRAGLRPPRPVGQAGHALGLEPLAPRMQRLPRRPVPLGHLADRRPAQHFPHRPVQVLRQRLLIHQPLVPQTTQTARSSRETVKHVLRTNGQGSPETAHRHGDDADSNPAVLRDMTRRHHQLIALLPPNTHRQRNQGSEGSEFSHRDRAQHSLAADRLWRLWYAVVSRVRGTSHDAARAKPGRGHGSEGWCGLSTAGELLRASRVRGTS